MQIDVIFLDNDNNVVEGVKFKDGMIPEEYTITKNWCRCPATNQMKFRVILKEVGPVKIADTTEPIE